MSVKRTNLYHSRQLFNTLIPTVAGGHSLTLVMPECTRGVIDPLYHSGHNDRDRQYECDRRARSDLSERNRCVTQPSRQTTTVYVIKITPKSNNSPILDEHWGRN